MEEREFIEMVQVVIEEEFCEVRLLRTGENPRFWDKKLIFIIKIDYPSVTSIMIKGALIALKAFNLFTDFCLIHFWVKLLFLPPVTILTLLFPLASLFIACNKRPALPILA